MDMSEADIAAVERIIATTINEIAHGDPDALAARIVAALGEGRSWCFGSPALSVIGAAAKVREVGADCVTGEKTDDQTKAGRTNGNRNLLVCHRPRATAYC
jgi:hypothetical protein